MRFLVVIGNCSGITDKIIFAITRFSTGGGTGGAKELEGGRAARQKAEELMLVLEPK